MRPKALPGGMTHAHRHAYLLIVMTLLAGDIMLAAMRPENCARPPII